MATWIVNDRKTCIEGTRTLWHLLEECLPDARFIGGHYSSLAQQVSEMPGAPDLVVRPASYFPPIVKDCPTITFVQEIHPPGFTRDMVLNVCRGSDLLVFNTEYTRSHYPELADMPYRTIPIGIDAGRFKPGEGCAELLPDSIAWVGAPHPIKGWRTIVEIVEAMTLQPFVIVTKTPIWEIPKNVSLFESVPHEDLPKILNSCRMILCTSHLETQHLAGIEAGMCGLPIIATKTGIYADLPSGPWGTCISWDANVEDWIAKIRACPPKGPQVRQFWLDAGLDERTCATRWFDAVEEVMAGARSRNATVV